MNSRWKQSLLQGWLVMLIASFVVSVMPVSAVVTAVVAAPVVKDLTKTPGSTFTIDVSVADVEALWGYKFFLYYNTTLLTATAYETYSPFTEVGAARINDTGGWVYLSYNMPFGETVGFSTVDPAPMAKITFRVDELGYTKLDIQKTVLADVDANAIPKEEIDGFFANVVLPNHDVAVTEVTVSPTKVAINDSVTITVTVENLGDFHETFNVSVYYDSSLIQTQTGIALDAGASSALTFTWKANVAKGSYTIKGVASQVPDEVELVNNSHSATQKVEVSSTSGNGSGPPPYLWYLIAGVVIVVVIAVLVYVLRSRKPKSQ